MTEVQKKTINQVEVTIRVGDRVYDDREGEFGTVLAVTDRYCIIQGEQYADPSAVVWGDICVKNPMTHYVDDQPKEITVTVGVTEEEE
jgi:hypothetical protein